MINIVKLKLREAIFQTNLKNLRVEHDTVLVRQRKWLCLVVETLADSFP